MILLLSYYYHCEKPQLEKLIHQKLETMDFSEYVQDAFEFIHLTIFTNRFPQF